MKMMHLALVALSAAAVSSLPNTGDILPEQDLVVSNPSAELVELRSVVAHLANHISKMDAAAKPNKADEMVEVGGCHSSKIPFMGHPYPCHLFLKHMGCTNGYFRHHCSECCQGVKKACEVGDPQVSPGFNAVAHAKHMTTSEDACSRSRNLEHGKSCRFECKEGFFPSKFLTCNDGQLSDAKCVSTRELPSCHCDGGSLHKPCKAILPSGKDQQYPFKPGREGDGYGRQQCAKCHVGFHVRQNGACWENCQGPGGSDCDLWARSMKGGACSNAEYKKRCRCKCRPDKNNNMKMKYDSESTSRPFGGSLRRRRTGTR